MKKALLIVDVQPCFEPPVWLVERARLLSAALPSVATVEHHDEDIVPFQKQLGWHPAKEDQSLVEADHVVIKHGYGPTTEAIELLKSPARSEFLFAAFRLKPVCWQRDFPYSTPVCIQLSSRTPSLGPVWTDPGNLASSSGNITLVKWCIHIEICWLEETILEPQPLSRNRKYAPRSGQNAVSYPEQIDMWLTGPSLSPSQSDGCPT